MQTFVELTPAELSRSWYKELFPQTSRMPYPWEVFRPPLPPTPPPTSPAEPIPSQAYPLQIKRRLSLEQWERLERVTHTLRQTTLELEPQAALDPQARTAMRDLLDHLAFRAYRGQQDLKGRPARPEPTEMMALKDHPVFQAVQEARDHRGQVASPCPPMATMMTHGGPPEFQEK